MLSTHPDAVARRLQRRDPVVVEVLQRFGEGVGDWVVLEYGDGPARKDTRAYTSWKADMVIYK